MKKLITIILMVVGLNLAVFAQSAGNSNFSVYPNPATTSFTVQYDFTQSSYVEIYDVLGVVVEKIKPELGTTDILIDCTSWKKGYYFCKLINDSKVEKIVKLVILN